MRLLSLTLHGTYKGLKDQTFDFQHSKGNIIALIGLNGSGKSQLLELIAESFAFLERKQRKDFTVRKALGFGFTLIYQLSGTTNHSAGSDGMSCGSPLAVAGGINNPIFKVTLAKGSKSPLVYIHLNGDWTEIHINSLELPYIIGYSSGLNENLQRSFMKNAVQYFKIMNTRLKRKKELAEDLNDEQISNINKRFLKKNPHIFEPERAYTDTSPITTESGEVITTEDGEPIESESFLLGLREYDTPATKSIYLDYDSAALFLLSLSILPRESIASLLDEVTYKYPVSATLRYDLRKGIAGLDTIRDVLMLVRIAGVENVTGVGKKTTDKQFDLYELDYLAGDISLDLTDDDLLRRLTEENYNDPLALFNRLFKAQQLGVGNWRGSTRTKLSKDNFIGTVKKPLKTKLPLSISELVLADDCQNTVCFDDLSDGEAQLLQILATSALFSQQRTLLLLDEPETHLNPSWRTHFHRQLNKAIAKQEENTSQPQVFLSTHSPFMVSSLRREDVMCFERLESNMIRMKPVENQTYGASFEVLIKEHFDLQSLISQTVVKDIKEHLPKDDTTAAREESKQWIMENVGESMEKAYLIRKLQS
ncbi:AAA family ATPase [Shewanella kaireitica]|uniref:AAA family ATPase n=1 Tax=Shewanella kaireitica TaxID=212021 RepID=UPI00200EA5FB|nr:AAA family ATPase [Shewanella kaireitica]MCL1095914.1 AAA family ATPase [Shewanella kaireitica]